MTENAAWKQNIFVKDYLLPSLSSLSRTTIHRTWKWERRKLQATYSFPCWRWFSFCQTVERKKSESHFTRDSERNVERHELINPSWCCQLYSIKKPDFFSIMVDESSDVSNREQVVFCVPWVDEDLLSLEDFIGLYEMEKTDATTMVSVIKDIILKLGWDKAKLCGQCYNGCRTMMGNKKEVATLIIRDVQALALSTHCYPFSESGMWGLDQKFYHRLKVIEYIIQNHEAG